MDELEILVQAILSLKDTTKSKQQILSELPKLEQQLQSDKNARVKIVAGLDIPKSKSLIQSQLNTLASQAKAPTIKVGVDVVQNNTTNGLKNIQTQTNQTSNVVNNEKQLNQYLEKRVKLVNEIFDIRSKIAKLKDDPNKNSELNIYKNILATKGKELALLRQENSEMLNIMSAENQRKYVIEETSKARERFEIAEAQAADKRAKAEEKLLQQKNSVNSEKQERLNKSLEEQLRIQKEILSYQAQIANLENNPNKASKVAELKSIVAKRQEELNAMQQKTFEATKLMTVEEQKEFLIKNTVKEQERLTIAERDALDIEQRSKALAEKKADTLEAQIKTYETINSKAAKAYKSEFDSLKKDLELARTTGNPEEITKLQTRFTTLKSTIKAAGKEGQTFFQKMIDGAKKFSSWMSLTTIISTLVRDIRKMVTTVVELDTALIDLKKTFKGTESDLKSFYYEANEIAKQLGVTTSEVIKSAAEWSRLGYSTKESAEQMAKMSSILKTVSPNMDMDTASSGLVSIVKAFGIDTNDVLDGVISKINILGRPCRV